MPVTLAVARQSLREQLAEYQGRAWKDTELDRWIYEGCKDLARQTEYLETFTDIDIDAHDTQIALPADIIRVYLSQFQNDGNSQWWQLDYADFNVAQAVNWINTSSSGQPTMISYWGAAPNVTAVLYPPPAQSGTLRVYYYRLPIDPRAQYTTDEPPVQISPDTVTLELPEGWEDTVYTYAEMMALRRDRDQRWQESKARYDEMLGRLFDLTRRHTDQNGQYIGTATPNVNAWLYGGDF